MLEVSFFESINYISIIVLNNFLTDYDTKNNNEISKQMLLLNCDFIQIVDIAKSLKVIYFPRLNSSSNVKYTFFLLDQEKKALFYCLSLTDSCVLSISFLTFHSWEIYIYKP